MAKARKQASGGARMKASGKSPVLLWLTQQEREDAFRASEAVGEPVTAIFLRAGRKEIGKILKNLASRA